MTNFLFALFHPDFSPERVPCSKKPLNARKSRMDSHMPSQVVDYFRFIQFKSDQSEIFQNRNVERTLILMAKKIGPVGFCDHVALHMCSKNQF